MLIVDDFINENIELKPLPKVKEGFVHEDYKTGAKFIYIRGEKQNINKEDRNGKI